MFNINNHIDFLIESNSALSILLLSTGMCFSLCWRYLLKVIIFSIIQSVTYSGSSSFMAFSNPWFSNNLNLRSFLVIYDLRVYVVYFSNLKASSFSLSSFPIFFNYSLYLLIYLDKCLYLIEPLYSLFFSQILGFLRCAALVFLFLGYMLQLQGIFLFGIDFYIDLTRLIPGVKLSILKLKNK